MNSEHDITQLLNLYRQGETSVLESLSPLIYHELQRISRRIFNQESSHHTLQPTALVNEAFLKLVDIDVSWQDRAHFYALASRMMRRLLVDYAKAKLAAKRGSQHVHLTLNTEVQGGALTDNEPTKVMLLNEAIDKLASKDERKAHLIELQYFAGLDFKEMAEVTGLSSSTIDRELRFSRALLKKYLSDT